MFILEYNKNKLKHTEQMTGQCANHIDAQVCMRVSPRIWRHKGFSTYKNDFSLEVDLVQTSSVGYGLGRVVKERLIALWETKASTIMCS